jgi:predicted dehydrogenase
MSDKMNVGLIGAGTITNGHVAALKLIPELANVVAVCDVNTEAAKEKADEFGAAVYGDYKEMLDKEDIDIAFVGLPHFLHCPVGLDVLNRGVNLFMEKPMANTVAECRQLIDAAAKSGKTLFVGQTHQYRSVLIKAKELIREGVIGEVKMIYDEIVAYYNWENRKPWFLDPAKAGGGALFNTSPHQADHLLYLIDSPVTKVKANVSALRPGQSVDSDTIAFIDYENGVQGFMGIFSGTKMATPGTLKVRVLGDHGSLQFNPFGNEIEVAEMDTVETIQTDAELNPIAAEWKECIASIKEKREPATNGAYGLNVVALLEAMVKSSNSKAEVAPERP